jgi:tetratricopeptide (TPR) repeat protein
VKITPVILVCICAASAAASPRAAANWPEQVRDPTIARANLSAYQSLLRRYCAGDPTAIDKLLQWDHEALLDAVTLINTGADETRPWSLTDLKAAVLMHTAGAMQLLREEKPDADLSFQLDLASRVLVRGADPQLGHLEPRIEMQIVEVRAFASRWYVATSRLLLHSTRFNAVHNLLALGRKRLPGDAAVLFESGTMEEFIATHPSRDISRDLAGRMSLSHSDSVANDLLKDHGNQLIAAERWLRESMTRDSSRVFTQLHLGRVLMLLGRDDEAVRLLDAVAATSPEHAYLAHLFRGAIEERRGSLDAASDFYRAAAAIDASRQVAVIALSQVLQRQGRGEESRALLELLLKTGSADEDPRWLYFFERSKMVEERLEALFSEMRK